MFYADFILTKRGPLAKVWLACHCERKLTKAQVLQTDLVQAVETIVNPQVKLALRTSGYLMFGVVRIFNRKTDYLCVEARDVKHRVQQEHLIEPVKKKSRTKGVKGDNSGMEILSSLDSGDVIHLELQTEEDLVAELRQRRSTRLVSAGAGEEQEESAGRAREKSLGEVLASEFEQPITAEDEFGALPEDDFDATAWFPEQPQAELELPPLPMEEDDFEEPPAKMGRLAQLDTTDLSIIQAAPSEAGTSVTNTTDRLGRDNTTLLTDAEHGFVLEPIDVTAATLTTARKKVSKRRALTVDAVLMIPSVEMKRQVLDASDLCRAIDVAPPTRAVMNIVQNSKPETLLTLAAIPLPASLQYLYKQLLVVGLPRVAETVAVGEEAEVPFDEDLPTELDTERPSRILYNISEAEEARLSASAREPFANLSNLPEHSHDGAHLYEQEVVDFPLEMEEVGQMEVSEVVPLQESLGQLPADSHVTGRDEDATRLLSKIGEQLAITKSCSFVQVLAPHQNRKEVAVDFLSTLFLFKNEVITLQQDESLGPITIGRGPHFSEMTLASVGDESGECITGRSRLEQILPNFGNLQSNEIMAK